MRVSVSLHVDFSLQFTISNCLSSQTSLIFSSLVYVPGCRFLYSGTIDRSEISCGVKLLIALIMTSLSVELSTPTSGKYTQPTGL